MHDVKFTTLEAYHTASHFDWSGLEWAWFILRVRADPVSVYFLQVTQLYGSKTKPMFPNLNYKWPLFTTLLGCSHHAQTLQKENFKKNDKNGRKCAHGIVWYIKWTAFIKHFSCLISHKSSFLHKPVFTHIYTTAADATTSSEAITTHTHTMLGSNLEFVFCPDTL